MRKHSLYFQLSPDPKVRMRLVESVPPAWAWMDGILLPPQGVVVAKNAGFRINRYRTGPGLAPGKESGPPDFYGLIVDQKLPSLIHFEEVQKGCQKPDVAEAREIAVGFLRQGFGGRLFFRSGFARQFPDSSPASCHFHFSLWRGHQHQEESGPQLPRVRLMWEEEHGGKESDIGQILAACRDLKLKQYHPEGVALKTS